MSIVLYSFDILFGILDDNLPYGRWHFGICHDQILVIVGQIHLILLSFDRISRYIHVGKQTHYFFFHFLPINIPYDNERAQFWSIQFLVKFEDHIRMEIRNVLLCCDRQSLSVQRLIEKHRQKFVLHTLPCSSSPTHFLQDHASFFVDLFSGQECILRPIPHDL